MQIIFKEALIILLNGLKGGKLHYLLTNVKLHQYITDDTQIADWYQIVINNIKLEVEFKDLGVTYDSLLLIDKHISEKVNKAYMMLGIIKRNFAHLSRKCFIILYKSLV